MPRQKLVVLTGAGISAESGLKTFRDSDGLWNGYDVYEVASPRGWHNNPALVLDFYNQRRKDVAASMPNDAHKILAQMESEFDITIITQNIDDLHERAGSSHVIHLHGEIFKMRSVLDPSIIYEIKDDIHLGDCAADGTQLRPHIVWFDEPVTMIETAIQYVHDAEIFVVIGTSLQVYPAASLIGYTPQHIPKYIIDKKIPGTHGITNLTTIEMPASTGVAHLKNILLEG